jgi:hypothetical protein
MCSKYCATMANRYLTLAASATNLFKLKNEVSTGVRHEDQGNEKNAIVQRTRRLKLGWHNSAEQPDQYD